MSSLGKKLASASGAIIRPYLTERSTSLATPIGGAQAPVYTFVVTPKATRALVAKAVREIYEVVPTRVNIINVKPRMITVRGKIGRRPGFKKALVYLKAGEKIDFV